MLLLRELLDEFLRQRAALRAQRDDAVLRLLAVRGIERGGDDVDAEHHPGAAAVRRVVDLPARHGRRVAVGVEAQVELLAEHCCDRALLGEPGVGMRNEGEDI